LVAVSVNETEYVMGNRFRVMSVLFVVLVWVIPCAGEQGDLGGGEAVLKLMPADIAFAGVFVNVEHLDKTVQAIERQIKPQDTPEGILAGLRRDVKVADWVDFSKPLAFGVVDPTVSEPVLWLSVSDFAAKAKKDGATETDGIWRLAFPGEQQAGGLQEEKVIYAKVLGDYVIAASVKEHLAGATVKDKSLADVLGARADLFSGREVLIHANADKYRPIATQGLAQAGPMLPMMAMMASQGGDPMIMTSMFTGAFEGIQEFVKQVDYVDVSISLTEKYADATVATGFKPGRIKDYLMKMKPASVELLGGISDQPYMMAGGTHLPGESSPLIDYVAAKALAAMPQDNEALVGAVRDTADLYRKMTGASMAMAFSDKGMRMSGVYLTDDPAGLLEDVKKSLDKDNPIMKQFGGGQTMEPLDPKKVGRVQVAMFAMKFDPTNPQGAQAASIYGEDARFGVGIVNKQVGFCQGTEQDIERYFTAKKVTKPLAGNDAVRKVLEGLPKDRNTLLLVDLAAAAQMMQGAMMGMPGAGAAAPSASGLPLAISVSLCGEPARLDVRVPIEALTKMWQGPGSQSPQ